ITISNARNWQQGEYICTAIVDGFKHASVSHFLHIRGFFLFLVHSLGETKLRQSLTSYHSGPPLITVPAELSANLGESIEMSCHISGRPKPLEVHWKRNGEELDYASGKMQVHQIPRSYGVESRLIIRDLREIDMGVYNCTANNGIGYDARAVTLKARGVTDVFGQSSSCLSVSDLQSSCFAALASRASSI
ncbi:immunoglobulin I-set domain protein, partial [Ancylostoma duodenale]